MQRIINTLTIITSVLLHSGIAMLLIWLVQGEITTESFTFVIALWALYLVINGELNDRQLEKAIKELGRREIKNEVDSFFDNLLKKAEIEVHQVITNNQPESKNLTVNSIKGNDSTKTANTTTKKAESTPRKTAKATSDGKKKVGTGREKKTNN